ncbi:MAG: hypothetical protein ABI885_29980, partial [Gammaproteobacteria bacterium]
SAMIQLASWPGERGNLNKSQSAIFDPVPTWEPVGLALPLSRRQKSRLLPPGNGATVRKSAAGDFFQCN